MTIVQSPSHVVVYTHTVCITHICSYIHINVHSSLSHYTIG